MIYPVNFVRQRLSSPIVWAGVLFFFTGVAKIHAWWVGLPIILATDPVTGLRLQYLFPVVGFIEVCVGYRCIWRGIDAWNTGAMGLLSISFLVYRGLALLYGGKVCPCLGRYIWAITEVECHCKQFFGSRCSCLPKLLHLLGHSITISRESSGKVIDTMRSTCAVDKIPSQH